ARRRISPGAVHADVPQMGGTRVWRRAAARGRSRHVQAVPHGTGGHRRRAPPGPARGPLEAAALRVRAAAAAHRHSARHRRDTPRVRARPPAVRGGAWLGGRAQQLAPAPSACARLPLSGIDHFENVRVKKFFTLEPNASALCLTLPSLRCCQALLAGGEAAWLPSLTFSPANFVPSTTVWPTPLAVSSTPVPTLPSPIFLAPVSTSRPAALTFDSSAAMAGMASQPTRAVNARAMTNNRVVTMAVLLGPSVPRAGKAGNSIQARRAGASVDIR